MKMHVDTEQDKEFIHYFPQTGRCLENQASVDVVVTWEYEQYNSDCLHFLLSLSFSCMISLLSQFRLDASTVLPPSSLHSPSLLTE